MFMHSKLIKITKLQKQTPTKNARISKMNKKWNKALKINKVIFQSC